MSVISVVNASKSFGDVEALSCVTLLVGEGEFYGLFGPNGAGKTTLLRIMTGQLEADSGSGITAGIPWDEPLAIKRAIGIVPEAETPPTFLTARETMELVCKIREVEDPEAKVDRWLDFFEMEEKEGVLCRDLSKGQRQKVMLAAAFIHEPRVLLLDEPFINLDPIYQRRLREYLRLLIEEGRTVFMCTHILEIAEKLCTRVAVIDEGRIVGEGALDEVMAPVGGNLEDAFMRMVEAA
jgi:ABC-2 type transport system ATP-binding protein